MSDEENFTEEEEEEEEEDLELGACLSLLSLKISEGEVVDEEEGMSTVELGDLRHPFILRDLEPSDYRKGHLKLLEQLTKVGDIPEEAFTKRVEEMRTLGNHHHVVVIEDVERQVIVATATLLVELKIARNCGKVGHIEDVVVDQTVRGQRLGQRAEGPSPNHVNKFKKRVRRPLTNGLRVVSHLTDSAKQLGCYKVILDCIEANAPFYEKCGFTPKERQMAQYF